jgi:hypothetical protein
MRWRGDGRGHAPAADSRGEAHSVEGGKAYWTPDEWEKCLAPEAISAHMIDPASTIEFMIKKKVNRALNSGTRDMALEDCLA